MSMRRVLLPQHFVERPLPHGAVIRDFHGLSMGTRWSARLLGGAAVDLQAGLQNQLDVMEAQMSHWRCDSDLSRFNDAPADSWQALPAEFFTVLAFAMDVKRDSGGAYDPCAGALIDAWGFGADGRFGAPDFAAPPPARLAELLKRHLGQTIELDHVHRRARQPGGARLDFSAVAKGFAVDRLALYLEAQGIRHYLVEVGGELRGAGTKPDGQPWWVALEQVADADAGDAAAAPLPESLPAPLPEIALALHGLSVATSGDYRRYFCRDDRRYSHTIDPRSGVPVAHRLASVTVVHAECMAADAWSTALTVLGARDGVALAERLGLAARFVSRDGDGFSEIMSSAFLRMLDE
jgi:thiamine biosynthesis lipoprotein